MNFLRHLSKHDIYHSAIKMLTGMLQWDDLEGLPAWASWSSGEVHLPQSFCNLGSFKLALADLGGVASTITAMSPTLVLAFGLALKTAYNYNLPMMGKRTNVNTMPADAEDQILKILTWLM